MAHNLIGSIVKVSPDGVKYRCRYGRVVHHDLGMPGLRSPGVAVLFPGFTAERWFQRRQCSIVKGVELQEYFKAMLKYGSGR